MIRFFQVCKYKINLLQSTIVTGTNGK